MIQTPRKELDSSYCMIEIQQTQVPSLPELVLLFLRITHLKYGQTNLSLGTLASGLQQGPPVFCISVLLPSASGANRPRFQPANLATAAEYSKPILTGRLHHANS